MVGDLDIVVGTWKRPGKSLAEFGWRQRREEIEKGVAAAASGMEATERGNGCIRVWESFGDIFTRSRVYLVVEIIPRAMSL